MKASSNVLRAALVAGLALGPALAQTPPDSAQGSNPSATSPSGNPADTNNNNGYTYGDTGRRGSNFGWLGLLGLAGLLGLRRPTTIDTTTRRPDFDRNMTR